jgi:hypothetical protein
MNTIASNFQAKQCTAQHSRSYRALTRREVGWLAFPSSRLGLAELDWTGCENGPGPGLSAGVFRDLLPFILAVCFTDGSTKWEEIR